VITFAIQALTLREFLRPHVWIPNWPYRRMPDAGGIMTDTREVPTTSFLTFIQAIAAIVSEGRLILREESLELSAMDTANVAMVRATLEAPGRCVGEEEIGVDITKLHTFLKEVVPMGTIRLTRMGGFTMFSQEGPLVAFGITLKNLELEGMQKSPRNPTIELGTGGVVEGHALNHAIETLTHICDRVAIKAGLTINPEAEGPQVPTPILLLKGDIPEGEGGVEARIPLTQGKGPEARALFSLDYLKDMVKALKEEPEVVVALAPDHPLRLTINRDGVMVDYLLAPRSEVD
jgi:proliferating cell nuclear antigen